MQRHTMPMSMPALPPLAMHATHMPLHIPASPKAHVSPQASNARHSPHMLQAELDVAYPLVEAETTGSTDNAALAARSRQEHAQVGAEGEVSMAAAVECHTGCGVPSSMPAQLRAGLLCRLQCVMGGFA